MSFAPHQVERLKDAGLMELACEMSREGKVTSDQLAAEPGRFLLCCRGGHGVTKLFDKVGRDRITLVWAMWSGYWEREGCKMREWAARHAVEPHFVHSGGHAWPDDLARLAGAISAKETVWVHTDSPCGAMTPPKQPWIGNLRITGLARSTDSS